MTNGEVLRVRAAMKPISTVPRALATDRHRHRRAGRRDQPAQRRVRGAARPASSWRRWSRWCSPTPSLEKFGGDSVAETRRNAQAYLDAPADPVTRARSWSWSVRRRRARPPSGTAARRRLGVAFRDTDADVEAAAGKPVADMFVDHGEAHFRALERAAVAARARRARRRAGARRRRGDSARPTRERLVDSARRRRRRLARRRPRTTAAGGSGSTRDRPLLRGQPAGDAAAHARDARPALRRGGHDDRAHRRPRARRRSSPRCWPRCCPAGDAP